MPDMQYLVSASLAAIQCLKWVRTALVFTVVYAYWRMLPQPHPF